MSPDPPRQSAKVVDQNYNTRLFIIITVIRIQLNAKDLRSTKNKEFYQEPQSIKDEASHPTDPHVVCPSPAGTEALCSHPRGRMDHGGAAGK